MDFDEEEKEQKDYYHTISLSVWLTKLISFQTDIISNWLSILLSPFLLLSSLVSAAKSVAAKSSLVVRKIGFGFLGAVKAGVVSTAVLTLAVAVGVGLVHLLVEEPLSVREKLHFDYTHVNPYAVFSFRGPGRGFGGLMYLGGDKKVVGVPVGHTFFVSLLLLLPDSDYNREIGVFQVSAELLSTNGKVLAKSSQPCMLPYRSLPVRLVQTFVMGIPLLLGISAETQKLFVPMMKHKEGYPRTEAIKFRFIPRAGTSLVPQLYKAEIIIKSHPTWTREIVRRWKWTFCVWASIYIYVVLVVVLVCCFRPVIFPISPAEYRRGECPSVEVLKQPQEREEEREVPESVRRWRENRSRRKAMLLRRVVLPDTAVGSLASSISITRDETATEEEEEDTGDSESVCLGG